MQTPAILALILLSGLAGYLLGIYQAARLLKKEVSKAAEEAFNALEDSEKTRLQ